MGDRDGSQDVVWRERIGIDIAVHEVSLVGLATKCAAHPPFDELTSIPTIGIKVMSSKIRQKVNKIWASIFAKVGRVQRLLRA